MVCNKKGHICIHKIVIKLSTAPFLVPAHIMVLDEHSYFGADSATYKVTGPERSSNLHT
jgi:hypothetical protein